MLPLYHTSTVQFPGHEADAYAFVARPHITIAAIDQPYTISRLRLFNSMDKRSLTTLPLSTIDLPIANDSLLPRLSEQCVSWNATTPARFS